jgi:hypothetical protein
VRDPRRGQKEREDLESGDESSGRNGGGLPEIDDCGGGIAFLLLLFRRRAAVASN